MADRDRILARLRSLGIDQKWSAYLAHGEVPRGASPSEGLAALDALPDDELVKLANRRGIKLTPQTDTVAVFYDGSETPTYLLHRGDTWRPTKLDMSWRMVELVSGQVIDEYHPNPPRRPITPFIVKE